MGGCWAACVPVCKPPQSLLLGIPVMLLSIPVMLLDTPVMFLGILVMLQCCLGQWQRDGRKATAAQRCRSHGAQVLESPP